MHLKLGKYCKIFDVRGKKLKYQRVQYDESGVSFSSLNLIIQCRLKGKKKKKKTYPRNDLSRNETCPRAVCRTCSDTTSIHRNILDTPGVPFSLANSSKHAVSGSWSLFLFLSFHALHEAPYLAHMPAK